MEIRRLTHFIALAEEGRFAAAAERMHLSQAAFSRSIQMLEGRMGVKLFERGAKGASLTPAGEMVLSRARNLVLDARNLQYDVELIRQGDAGEITLGAAPVPATVIVPELLSRLRRNSPRLVTRVRLGNLPALLGQLNAQAIDFCLGDPRLVPPQARYAMVSVGRQIGAFYGRIDHPLTQMQGVDAEAIRRYGVATIAISPALMDHVALAYGFKSHADFPLAVECDDLATLVHLAQHTDVLALLTRSVGDAHPNSLCRLATQEIDTPFADVHAIWLKERTLSPAAQRAISLAQELGAGLLAPVTGSAG